MYQSVTNINNLNGQGLSGFANSSTSGKANLLQMLSDNKNKTSAKTQDPIFTSQNFSPVTTSNVNDTKGTYDPKTGTWSTTGNQSEILQDLTDRQGLNQTIKKVLAGVGIKLASNEKMTISVDQNGQVTTGGISNAQKKAKIESALNGTKDFGKNLLLNIEKVKDLNGTQDPMQLKKWLVSGFLKKQTGQDLSDLKLVNGKITGANDKLQKILSSDPQDFGKDAAYYQGAITDLKSVLTVGVNKIPDMNVNIDYKNGSLVDKNVKYGFGPDQLKSWFGAVMSGKARLDGKA